MRGERVEQQLNIVGLKIVGKLTWF